MAIHLLEELAVQNRRVEDIVMIVTAISSGRDEPAIDAADRRPRVIARFNGVKRKSFEHMDCPIAQSLELVGEWWTPLILRDVVLVGLTRFDDIQNDLGIAPNVLTSRLNHLVDSGLLERRQYNDRPPRFEYVATEAALDFKPVLTALADWGRKWTAGPGVTATTTPQD